MIINVSKQYSTDKEDVFTYRDEYNDEQVISFPKKFKMTEKEVEDYLNS